MNVEVEPFLNKFHQKKVENELKRLNGSSSIRNKNKYNILFQSLLALQNVQLSELHALNPSEFLALAFFSEQDMQIDKLEDLVDTMNQEDLIDAATEMLENNSIDESLLFEYVPEGEFDAKRYRNVYHINDEYRIEARQDVVKRLYNKSDFLYEIKLEIIFPAVKMENTNTTFSEEIWHPRVFFFPHVKDNCAYYLLSEYMVKDPRDISKDINISKRGKKIQRTLICDVREVRQKLLGKKQPFANFFNEIHKRNSES